MIVYSKFHKIFHKFNKIYLQNVKIQKQEFRHLSYYQRLLTMLIKMNNKKALLQLPRNI